MHIERELMLGLYSIRKLMDAHKLTDVSVNSRVKSITYKNIKQATILNWHKIDKLYDLESGRKKNLSLRFVCNQLVHSYIFMVSENEQGGFAGVFVNSETERNKNLFYFSANELKRIFLTIGNDYPSDSHLKYNPSREDYDVKQS